MNALLPSRFVERFDRLLLGVEPTDAVRMQRVAHRVDIAIEPAHPWVDPLTDDQRRWLTARIDSGVPLSELWPRASRHPSNRYVVTYRAGPSAELAPHLDLRVMDDSQRIVPRRLRVPIVALGTPENLVILDALPVGQRSRFPAFFPGAAYDVSDRVTGLRGRVVISDGAVQPTFRPVRWPRVEARLVTLGAPGAPIAWAHGDQHGEFLLVLPPEAVAAAMVELPKTLTLDVTAYGRRGLPAVVPPSLVRRADPFWDLPLEQVGAPNVAPMNDPVALGRTIPADYDGVFSQLVTFTYSEVISSGVPPFDIT